MFSRKSLAIYLLMAGLALAGRLAKAQNPVQKVGKYAVELRIPTEGVYAEEETDIEFRVTDTSQDDPVQGAPPVVKATVRAQVIMPSMPSMPQQTPKTHSEGVPGDYGVVTYFPHGGDYQLDLAITPPGDKAFTASFKVAVQDAEAGKNRKPKPKPYTLEVRATPATPRAGEPAELILLIRNRDTKRPVTEFDTVHERQIHLMVVSKDLSRFAHEHPDAGPDGRFTLRYAFPTGGEYHLFADVAPHGAGSQILMQPIQVTGPPPTDTGTLRPTAAIDPVDGVRVTLLTDAAKLTARRSLDLAFALKEVKTDAPITDLEPYLGAMAHLMLIQQDGATFVHSHPNEADPANGKNGTLTFLARFPKPGLYKGWLQFQRAGQVQTVPFVVAAKESGGR
jgi:hypothetical protein